MKQKLIFSADPAADLQTLLAGLDAPSVFVIADENTARLALPAVEGIPALKGAASFRCRPGDTHKSVDSLAGIWRAMNRSGITRSSAVVNVGGGMVTDMGGFAAATFKRGVEFVNVPTTLLAAVDASVGGKTGVNFQGCKNEIGVFAEPVAAIISTVFFRTLPVEELLSGYAEMLKHALLMSRGELAALLDFGLNPQSADSAEFMELLRRSVRFKAEIVEEDIREQGLRRILNLGHTAGHAFESYAMEVRRCPVPHGYAVAWGMVVELVLSSLLLGFPADTLRQYAVYVRDNYGAFPLDCDDYPALIRLMEHDKKNRSTGEINFTLLADVGDYTFDNVVGKEQIEAALDIYRDLMGQ